MNLSWSYLNGSIRYCPDCHAYGTQKHTADCERRRWSYRRNATDEECITRVGEAIATITDTLPAPPPIAARVAKCAKPSSSCVASQWAVKGSQGWLCLRDPIGDRIPQDAQQVVRIDADGQRATCLHYRPDAWVGGEGRRKTPKRMVEQRIPQAESDIRAWLTLTLDKIAREGRVARSLVACGYEHQLLPVRAHLGLQARLALAGEPYDDALDREVYERMMAQRPWR